MYLAIVINNKNEYINNVKDELSIAKKELAIRQAASKEVAEKVNTQKIYVDRVVKEIETVYVPQFEYITNYIGDSNDSCNDSNKLITSIIF